MKQHLFIIYVSLSSVHVSQDIGKEVNDAFERIPNMSANKHVAKFRVVLPCIFLMK